MLSTDSLELIARVCHNANKGLCEATGDNSQPSWKDAPQDIKDSTMDSVSAVIETPDISGKEMHANWKEFKTDQGWVYGEVKDADEKTHPLICDYDDLGEIDKAKDLVFIGVVNAFLGK